MNAFIRIGAKTIVAAMIACVLAYFVAVIGAWIYLGVQAL